MKFATAALMGILTTSGAAAAPEDAYLTARDAAIARVAKLDENALTGEAYTAKVDKESAALEPLLRALVGPVAIKGFPGPGKSSLETLSKSDEGFGLLDGLFFSGANGNSSLIVTTPPLLRRWLAQHQTWWENGEINPPAAPEAAFQTNAFYTQAISTDSAFSIFAELPLVKPPKANLAVALLDGRSQEATPDAPDEIVAALISGGRVLIAAAPLQAKFVGAPACTKTDRAAQTKIQAADDANVAAGRKNDALAAKLVKLRTEAEAGLRACFQDKAKSQKGFAAAQAQAQALIDAMAQATP